MVMVMVMLQCAIAAESPSSLPQESPSSLPQVVVPGELERGAVLGDTPPQIQLGPPEIQSLGVGSVSDVLVELTPETQSNRGRTDVPPVLLLNGRRISNPSEIGDIPAEAIERVEVFPEDLALKYGYAPDQKVVNFVVREHYRALSADGEGAIASAGGAAVGKGNLDYIRLEHGGRLNLDLSFEHDDMLLESARGLHTVTTGTPFDRTGNLTAPGTAGGEIDPGLSALAGETVTLAGVPLLPAGTRPSLADFAATANMSRITDLSPDRSLRPDGRKLHLNAVSSWTTGGGIHAALNAGVDVADTRSLQGLAGESLLVPAGNPFSPFTNSVQVDRFLAELGPLRQWTDSVTDHLSASMDGALHGWTWSVAGNAQRALSHTTTETGVDLSAAQGLLDADDSALDPFAPISPELLSSRTDDHATQRSDSGSLQLLAQGVIRELPAGELATSIKLGEEASRIQSYASVSGSAQDSSLFRNVASGLINVDIPLASRKRGVLGAFGELTAYANLTVQQVSHFGSLDGLNVGLNWSPSERWYAGVSVTGDSAAPSLALVSSPDVLTPNVPLFDYIRGQSVAVTQLSGGNPTLLADHRRALSVNLSYRPLPDRNFTVNAGFFASDTKNLSGPLPPATAASEAAFPDRYLRDGDGTLIEIDGRAVNLAREDREPLRFGFNSYWPLGSHASAGRTAFQFAIHDTWFLRDAILVRDGLPPIDLLNGGTTSAGGGQPRHQMDLQAGFSASWCGVRISDRWHGATTVDDATPASNLHFSQAMSANLRLYANLGDAPAYRHSSWAQGLRLVLAVDNAFNEHQSVHDGNGAIPIAYQSAYLDPLGRVVHLEARKVF